MTTSCVKKISLLLFVFSGITFTYCLAQSKTILQGQVKQSDGSPMRNSAVVLLQYSPASKTYYIIDSSYTDANGKYAFDDSLQYFICAIPNGSSANELRTYYGNTLFSQNATPVAMHFGNAVTANFATTKKVNLNKGDASVGGEIRFGKNIYAIPKLTVFLADKDKNPVAVTSTNTSGKFQFQHIAYGDYYLWIDFTGVDNTTADIISLSALNPVKDSLHFQIDDGNMNLVENTYSSIKEALKNKENVYLLNLNSLQQNVGEKSFSIRSDGAKMLSAKIGELTNLEILTVDINSLNFLPAEIGTLSKLTVLSASLNKINSLPAEMENLKNLKSLDLGKNNFNKLPDIITKYTSLEILNFENNPITTIPPTINSLKNLKELDLASCFELLTLPAQIGELTNLETLNLSNCIKLKSLPKEILNLKNLKTLDISGTKISAAKFQKAFPGCDVRVTKK